MRSYSDGVTPWRSRTAESIVLCMDPIRERLDHRLESEPSIGASERRFAGALGMRHHPHDVAAPVADAGDVVERSVGVDGRSGLAVLVGVAEHDLAVRLQLREHVGIREVVALAV